MLKITLHDGTDYESPSENLENIQRILGHKIKTIESIGSTTEFKFNRQSLEEVAKNEFKIHWKKVKSMTDDELVKLIKAPRGITA